MPSRTGCDSCPSDFEVADGWRKELLAAGFDPAQPAVVASTGVSMYLTKEATAATLREIAGLATGTTLVMSFLLPIGLLAAEDRPGLEIAQRGAAAAGTPFRSFFTPDEIVTLAREAGFADARHVSSADQNARYFTGAAGWAAPANRGGPPGRGDVSPIRE